MSSGVKRWWDRKALREELRALAIVDPVTNCWLWPRRRSNAGYGQIRVEGKHVGVHKVAAWAFLGDERARSGGFKFYTCHHCDNPPCFNPDHLFVGQLPDNARDSVNKCRRPDQKRTHCVNGHAFSGTNVKVAGMQRICRACHADRERNRRRRITGHAKRRGWLKP